MPFLLVSSFGYFAQLLPGEEAHRMHGFSIESQIIFARICCLIRCDKIFMIRHSEQNEINSINIVCDDIICGFSGTFNRIPLSPVGFGTKTPTTTTSIDFLCSVYEIYWNCLGFGIKYSPINWDTPQNHARLPFSECKNGPASGNEWARFQSSCHFACPKPKNDRYELYEKFLMVTSQKVLRYENFF